MRSKTTLAQIAALSGFSTATVSRAFAHPELLNAETLRTINDASLILRYKISDGKAELGSDKRISGFSYEIHRFPDVSAWIWTNSKCF